MRVIPLPGSGATYSCNVYLVLGDWSGLADVNTLVDVGRDPAVLDALAQAPTGVGKKPVEQVLLTHGHYDHAGLLQEVRRRYQPLVCAASGAVENPDRTLADGDRLKAGDRTFEVLYAPGHSSDSICLYCREEGVLFAGDAPLLVQAQEAGYEPAHLEALRRISRWDVRTVYFGHGAPLREDCNTRLRTSLSLIERNAAREMRRTDTGRKS
jgi:glyoxylase-like metal-dependent hydrolase (beta-lactamase superfamily II)